MTSLINLVMGSLDSAQDAALLLGILLVVLVLGLIFYIYLSFVFFSIGKKFKVRLPRIALIPLFGPVLIAYNVSKMHWWPWITMLVFVPGTWFVCFVGYNIIYLIASIVSFCVFLVCIMIWNSRMFWMLKRPKWWGISVLIPFVYVVFVGLALRRPENKKPENKLPSQTDFDVMKGGE